MSSRLQDAAIEQIAKQKGETLYREAQTDHWLDEMHEDRPSRWSSRIGSLFQHLAQALRPRKRIRRRELPGINLRQGPGTVH